MNLIIHRGTKEIGGSCVELQTQDGRILIDFGLPLTEERPQDKKKYLPDIKGLYQKPEFDGVLISHSHQDHYGLLSFIHPDIPVYLSKGTKELIELSCFFNQTDCQPRSVKVIRNRKPFQIKDIKVTPFLVDHSGFDAMGFLLEAEGKRIFYSGDFRGHGRKGVLFQEIIKSLSRDIDFLIMEGTMLSRKDEPRKTEKDIENELVAQLKSAGKLTLLSCSSQNIDRIVSAYRACVRTDTLLVLDPYSAYVLYMLKDISKGLPQYDWGKNMRIFFIPNKYTNKVLNDKKLFKFASAKISKEDVFSLKHKMLVKDSFAMRSILRAQKLLPGTKLIYSQWEGYLKEQKEFWDKNNVEVVKVHTSGHAYLKDLVKFVKALKPRNIIPIHTENADKYGEYFESKIIVLKDGETFNIC